MMKEMNEMKATKGLVIVRIVALSILALYFGIMAYGWISGTELPDAAVRFLGAVDLIALPAAVFCSVRIRMMRKGCEV